VSTIRGIKFDIPRITGTLKIDQGYENARKNLLVKANACLLIDRKSFDEYDVILQLRSNVVNKRSTGLGTSDLKDTIVKASLKVSVLHSSGRSVHYEFISIDAALRKFRSECKKCSRN
jgi:hypothetical protein